MWESTRSSKAVVRTMLTDGLWGSELEFLLLPQPHSQHVTCPNLQSQWRLWQVTGVGGRRDASEP